MKVAANEQSYNKNNTLFSPLTKSLNSQFLNGKTKEGKALRCSDSFYGTQMIVHNVILGILCQFCYIKILWSILK